MADAICGPSNPLQQFKQQSQYDRTLQQDRLTSRSSPSQGFRSHNPNATLLDPEFEAFQAGLPAPDLPFYQQQQHHQSPAPSFAASSAAPSWATDFQHLQISSPPPSLSSFAQQSVPQMTNGWANGFREHIAKTAPRAQNSSPSPLAFQQRARYGYSGYQSALQQQNYTPAPLIQSKGKERVTEEFDDAAFERAFDLAREEMIMEDSNAFKDVEAVAQSQSLDDASLSKSDVMREIFRNIDEASVQDTLPLDATMTDDAEALREALDRQEEAKDNQSRQEEDELAATAQELLEKVEHNQTDKFRNSQFLGLMRKLRDREVKVEGDKMVETANPAVSFSLNKASPSTANAPTLHFDNTEQRPSPLAGAQLPVTVDTRPPDYGIPAHEQDHDLGRVRPEDGQEVVDLLNTPLNAGQDDPGMSSALDSTASELERAEEETRVTPSASLSEMLYGADGTLAQPINWQGLTSR